MAKAPSIKGLAVSIMDCTPDTMRKVPSTLDKEPSIRLLAPILAIRAKIKENNDIITHIFTRKALNAM